LRATKIRLVWMLTLVSAAAVTAAAAQTANGSLGCLIEPNVVVTVSSPVDGIVETVTVDRGDIVKQGQVLATLESSVEEAVVAIAKAKTELEAGVRNGQARTEHGKRKLQRIQELYKKGNISVHELEEAELEKNLAEVSLLDAIENKRLASLEFQRASAALALRTIKSPVTGVVVERMVSPGDFRNNIENKILKLAQIDPLRVEVFVPVSMLKQIAVGMKAEVLPEPPHSTAQIAQVTVVDRVVDAASGTFGVRLSVKNPGYKLPAGLKCKVRFLQK